MKQILAVAMLMLAAAPVSAATPPPNAAPASAPIQNAPNGVKPSPQPLWALVKTVQDNDAAVTRDYNLFVMHYQTFGASVYAPWCVNAGGVLTVKLAKAWAAWPATVWCHKDDPKGPGRSATAPVVK